MMIFILMLWIVLWVMGGWLLAQRLFKLRVNECLLAGIAIGFFTQTWLVNILAQVINLTTASWLSAAMVFCAGALSHLLPLKSWRGNFKLSVSPWQLVLMGGLFIIAYKMARGMAIFDDYAHLPTVSLMATGDIPPHFYLDPSTSYRYHYFLLLFSAQLMRLGGLAPWNAVDAARALTFSICVLLCVVWVQRLTWNRAAGVLGGLMLILGMGTRYLLLVLPSGLLSLISKNIQLLDNTQQTGVDLLVALSNTWKIDGGGPLGIPFAYINGIYTPGIFALHGGTGLAGLMLLYLFLLLAERVRGTNLFALPGTIIMVILWSTQALISESDYILSLAAWGLLALLAVIRARSWRIPSSLLSWLGIIFFGSIISLIQGGALTEIARERILSGLGTDVTLSQQTIAFQLVWPPEIVSSHLGVLSLTNPYQALTALIEIGPILLVFPLALIWGYKSIRYKSWYMASLAAGAIISLGFVCFEFSGFSGVRNTSRIYQFIGFCSVFAVPVGWRWLSLRKKWIQALAFGLAGITMLGGVVLFINQIPAMQKPVYSYFIEDPDVKIYQEFWNKLDPGTLVFDPKPSRGITLLGLGTNSSYNYYNFKPEWLKLRAQPDPRSLHKAGFRYVYYDRTYLSTLPDEYRQALESPCVKTIKKVTDPVYGARILLDIGGCY